MGAAKHLGRPGRLGIIGVNWSIRIGHRQIVHDWRGCQDVLDQAQLEAGTIESSIYQLSPQKGFRNIIRSITITMVVTADSHGGGEEKELCNRISR